MSKLLPSETLVTVTGATGFIARHCIRELLSRGYQVRGTLRDRAREASLRSSLSPLGGDRLSLVVADLLDDRGWIEATQGAKYLLHVASPVPKFQPKDQLELIRPARDGTLRVLKAARETGVSRVVVTSSIAAVLSGKKREPGRVFDERDWADPAGPLSAYAKSKTLAEQATWAFAGEPASRGLELTTLNPVYVLGPALGVTTNLSNEIVGKLLRREVPGVLQVQFGLVDVRDVATAQVLAMLSEKARGERFILVSDTAWMEEIARVLLEAGYRPPTWRIPNLLVSAVAPILPAARLFRDVLGKPFLTTSEKAKDLLGWSGRSMRAMVLDTAQKISGEQSRVSGSAIRNPG